MFINLLIAIHVFVCRICLLFLCNLRQIYYNIKGYIRFGILYLISRYII